MDIRKFFGKKRAEQEQAVESVASPPATPWWEHLDQLWLVKSSQSIAYFDWLMLVWCYYLVASIVAAPVLSL